MRYIIFIYFILLIVSCQNKETSQTNYQIIQNLDSLAWHQNKITRLDHIKAIYDDMLEIGNDNKTAKENNKLALELLQKLSRDSTIVRLSTFKFANDTIKNGIYGNLTMDFINIKFKEGFEYTEDTITTNIRKKNIYLSVSVNKIEQYIHKGVSYEYMSRISGDSWGVAVNYDFLIPNNQGIYHKNKWEKLCASARSR